MKIEYDKEVDALYILLRDVQPADTKDIDEGVTVDVDEEGHIIGLEILNATTKLGWESILNVSIENMPVQEAPV